MYPPTHVRPVRVSSVGVEREGRWSGRYAGSSCRGRGFVGGRGLGRWLAAHGHTWLTGRRLTVAVSILAMAVIVALALLTNERALY